MKEVNEYINGLSKKIKESRGIEKTILESEKEMYDSMSPETAQRYYNISAALRLLQKWSDTVQYLGEDEDTDDILDNVRNILEVTV